MKIILKSGVKLNISKKRAEVLAEYLMKENQDSIKEQYVRARSLEDDSFESILALSEVAAIVPK